MANERDNLWKKFEALQRKVFNYMHGEKENDDVVAACCMAEPSMTGNPEICQTFAAFIGPKRAEKLLDLCDAFQEYWNAARPSQLRHVTIDVDFPVEAYEEGSVPESLQSEDGHDSYEADMRWLPRPSDDEPCAPFRFDLAGMDVDEDGIRIRAYSHHGEGEYEFRIYASTLREIAAGPEAGQRQEAEATPSA